MNRIVIVWVVCVLAMVLIVGRAGIGVMPSIGVKNITENATEENGEALIKADFTLVGAGGKTVRASDLKGKYLLVYFGFTHCPDVCPTSLLVMNNVLSHLGKNADKVQPLFITVDPERDTPAIASKYAQNFGKNFMGLSGTPAQIKHAAEGFKVYYSKVNDSTSALGYGVDHSSFIYLMGPDGKYLAHFPSTDPEQEMIAGLRDYIR